MASEVEAATQFQAEEDAIPPILAKAYNVPMLRKLNSLVMMGMRVAMEPNALPARPAATRHCDPPLASMTMHEATVQATVTKYHSLGLPRSHKGPTTRLNTVLAVL
eukprot:CAMPEP_0204495962 /NCGR_PEP_ID=MMETSP0471-20130131/87637_1 /ASSEMBLY_ACC=CAM_ASM_000602 /TAXON_ID=2969 /ORGANISM="Oxyrrhis marina" /LENGTH=105 /DNA_ID=CAMNT_0051500269 /DNA_START=185 /DNA_END=502 /DNA_ORIENTATION=-